MPIIPFINSSHSYPFLSPLPSYQFPPSSYHKNSYILSPFTSLYTVYAHSHLSPISHSISHLPNPHSHISSLTIISSISSPFSSSPYKFTLLPLSHPWYVTLPSALFFIFSLPSSHSRLSYSHLQASKLPTLNFLILPLLFSISPFLSSSFLPLLLPLASPHLYF